MKIKHIFDDGQVTYYEIGEIMKRVAEAIDELPRSIATDVSEEERGATERLEQSIVKINNKIAGFLKFISDSEDKVYQASEAYYRKADKATRELNDKLSRLPDLHNLYVPTHQMKELLDIAERCEGLSDAQWSRVIELAKAFSQKS